MIDEELLVAVSVATLWTDPLAPRPMDRAALQNPVDLRSWLAPMTVEERRDLADGARVQTQALYGTRVRLLEVSGHWVRILVPSQPCFKDARGYPGWVPRVQLAEANAAADIADLVIVSEPTAFLYRLTHEPELELSFGTELRVVERGNEVTRVATPHGERLIETANIERTPATSGALGRTLVDDGLRFLGLHYLWGGTSAFGFDCSGLSYALHKRRGVLIPRDAFDQAQSGTRVAFDELEPGDLLFFAHDRGRGRVHHVALYAGDGMMLHSPNSAKSVELVAIAGHELEAEHVFSRRYQMPVGPG
jgi:cell wall-associated NlpC family hydrolase